MEGITKNPRLEESIEITKDDDTEDNKESFKLWQKLTYDVLCIIFKHLNDLDLSKASLVCKSWFEIANHERRIRGPSCFKHSLLGNIYTTSSCEDTDKEFIDYYEIGRSISFSFTVKSDLFVSEGCHGNYLPLNCDLISLNTYGTVINNEETQKENHDAVCMLFPAVRNISISTYCFNVYKWKRTRDLYLNRLREVIKLPDHHDDCHIASCLILLCDWSGRGIAFSLVKSLKNWFCNSKSTIWGGIAKDLSVCTFEKNTRVCNKKTNCVAITISGKLKTWTILLDSECDTKEMVKNKLQEFKESIQLKRHSVGFMYACCVRGRNMFEEPNVESTIFKELFPKVPLIGCFGDGEFGAKITNEMNDSKRIKWFHSVSTSFMIITYN
ncbi:hypothetical protein M0802_013481 [Mischocyttarus mexicanus]|nr:hypothetical protein M0802_013481 [Mischocyttarus mexicanus]